MTSVSRHWTPAEDTYLEDNYLAKTHEEIGAKLGRTARAVRNRAWRLGFQKKVARHTEETRERVRAAYARHDGQPLDLDALANELGMTRAALATLAHDLGVTDITRPKTEATREGMRKRTKAYLAEHGHPRGMLGKSHTKATRRAISKSGKARYARMTEEERGEHVLKALKTKHAKGNLLLPRKNVTWKQGWRTVGGRRIYFRSKWEMNYARYLEWLRERGEIKAWEYEPTTFWFEAIKRGTRSYTPDFRVTERSGKVVYHEVKGWMDARSKTKLKRMAKYHPEVEILLIDADTFRSIATTASKVVPGWE